MKKSLSITNILVHDHGEIPMNEYNNIKNTCDDIPATNSVQTNTNLDTQSNDQYETFDFYLLNEKAVSILLHLFIMVSFEIYFYFQYVIIIEREQFLQKINDYADKMSTNYNNNYDPEYKLLVCETVLYNPVNKDQLYNSYQMSLHTQREKIEYLFHVSLIMWGAVSFLLFVTFVNCMCVFEKIRWKWILGENIFMFIALGIFEYLFFTNIIMNFVPVTDAELQYIIYNDIINTVNGTC